MIEKLLINFDHILNPRRLAYAWITGGALWLAWLLSVSLGPGNMDLAGQVIGTDYLQFQTAGTTVRLGESARLFDFDYQARLELQIAGPELVNFHAFIMPPFFAYIFVPLSYLPYPLSFALWSIFGLFSLYVSLRWLNIPQPIKALLWSLTFFPVFATISFGQNSLLSLLLLSLSFTLWRRRSPFLAGLVSSMLLYKPQLVVGIGLLWLLEWRRDWKALFGLLSGAICLVVICIASMPKASLAYLDFSRNELSSMLSWEQFPLWHAHTWRAFWYLLLPGQLSVAEILGLIFSLIGLVVFLIFWKRQRGEDALMFTSAICLTLWVSPHSMIYDWSILLIPAVILWDGNKSLRPLWKPLFALLWIALLLSGPMTVAQLKLIPVAIQISLPIFGIAIAIAFKALMRPTKPFTNLSSAKVDIN
jgi:hypothetical protein